MLFPSLSRRHSSNSLSSSSIDDDKQPDETISALITVHRVHVPDLSSAFSEGFLGYSIDIQVGEATQETQITDIKGRAAEWEASYSL